MTTKWGQVHWAHKEIELKKAIEVLKKIVDNQKHNSFSTKLRRKQISDSLKAAAQNVRVATNSHLLDNLYLEGLKGRKFTWQITNLDVRAENLKTFYDGASVGLSSFHGSHFSLPVASCPIAGRVHACVWHHLRQGGKAG